VLALRPPRPRHAELLVQCLNCGYQGPREGAPR